MLFSLQKKERGEQLVDRTIFEDFEEHREQGKKSKTFASILAMFPAGHATGAYGSTFHLFLTY